MVKEYTYDEIIFEQIGFDFYGTINSILPFINTFVDEFADWMGKLLPL